MKKLSKLILTQLSKEEMSKQEMTMLLGGSINCGCGCNGPSSLQSNGQANVNSGYSQSYGGNKVCTSWSGGSNPSYQGSTFHYTHQNIPEAFSFSRFQFRE